MAKIKILAFVPELGGGGAEMHLMRVFNHLDKDRFELLIVAARAGGSYESRLSDTVRFEICTRRIRSSTLSVYASIPRLRLLLQRERPQIVFSLLEHSSVALRDAMRGLRSRPFFCAGIQNNFSSTLKGLSSGLKLWYTRQFTRMYASSDHVIALSRGVADDLIEQVPVVKSKTTVIYNAGYEAAIHSMAQEDLEFKRPEGPLFVACGRLGPQKDYPTMLRAFARLNMTQLPTLWILGLGPDEEKLKVLADELGICDRVTFLGFQTNPFKYLATADVVVLSSRWEGFGNVLVEALALGLPIVSTDCPHGPAEILEEGKYGALVPVEDDVALAKAMKRVYVSPNKFGSAQTRCRRSDCFEAGKIALKYSEAFEMFLGK